MNVTLERLNGLLAPCVESMGYELTDLELRHESRGQVLRLFIDRESGIALDDCERVSGQVGALLDVEDPIEGRYSLEVSSPGLDRKLAKPEHFDRFAGRRVLVKARSGVHGRRNFAGVLRERRGGIVVLDLTEGDEEVRLPLDDIVLARLTPEFRFED